jgi:hypothetical protein
MLLDGCKTSDSQGRSTSGVAALAVVKTLCHLPTIHAQSCGFSNYAVSR